MNKFLMLKFRNICFHNYVAHYVISATCHPCYWMKTREIKASINAIYRTCEFWKFALRLSIVLIIIKILKIVTYFSLQKLTIVFKLAISKRN